MQLARQKCLEKVQHMINQENNGEDKDIFNQRKSLRLIKIPENRTPIIRASDFEYLMMRLIW